MTTAARLLTAAVAAATALVLSAAGASSATRPDLVVGVSLPTYHYDPGAVTTYERATGQDVDVLQTFISWQYTGQPSLSDFPAARAKQIAAVGAQLEVTWVPSNPAGGRNQPAFSLASIARGDHDTYIAKFAKAVKAFGQPVRLRFAHEMNGTWQPFNEANSGNRPGDFVKAWRHVHDVVAKTGATNATWVWSADILYTGGTPLTGLYPGDAYVDEVGIDGYSYPTTGCPAPSRLFGSTVAAVRSITSKPLRITEVGLATTCPNRSAWIASFAAYLSATPTITGYTWWERTGDGRDYRVATTTDVAAFRNALGTAG